ARTLVGLAEPVVPHRRSPSRSCPVAVLAMQQLQRDPDLRELAVDLVPARLGIDAVVLSPAGEEPRIHLGIRHPGDIVVADPYRVRGRDDRVHRVSRHALRGDLPTREALAAEAKHQLRLDLPYHFRLLLLPRETARGIRNLGIRWR